MERLVSLEQIEAGQKLKIITDDNEFNKTFKVIKLIPMKNEYGDGSLKSAGSCDTEILLDKKRNTYFSMNKFLKGTSWVKEAYVIRRYKQFSLHAEIILTPSKQMHEYHKEHTLDDLCTDMLKVLAGYHTSYTGNEYLIDVGLMTKNRLITKLGKEVLLRKYYKCPHGVRLIKPEVEV